MQTHLTTHAGRVKVGGAKELFLHRGRFSVNLLFVAKDHLPNRFGEYIEICWL